MRTNYFDIEVYWDFTKEFKEVFNAGQQPIISIQAYDTLKQNYFLFLQRYDLVKSSKIVTLKDVYDKDMKVHKFTFGDEADLLEGYSKFVKELDFDIHSGFNINNFDFPYIYKRFSALDLDGNMLSPLGVAYYSEKRGKTIIQGTTILDVAEMMRKFTGKQREGNSLDALSMKFLKVGKLTKEQEIMKWYDTDLPQFERYGMIDVQLTHLLDKQLGLSGMALSIMDFSHINYKDVFSAGKCVEYYIMSDMRENLVFDNVLEIAIPFSKGAEVRINPKLVYYGYGGVVDYSRMYPNIIKTFNISPETIFMYDPATYNEKDYILLPNRKYMTYRNKIGIFPKAVERLFELREKYETKMNNTPRGTDLFETVKRQRQNAKDRANAISGLFEDEYSRFKHPLCGDAIRSTGRYLLNLAGDVIIASNHKLLYGDTDSNFVATMAKEFEEALKDLQNVEHLINQEISSVMLNKFGIKMHSMTVDMEKIFDMYLSVGVKKKYVLHVIRDKGKTVDELQFTGFENKRSDASDYASEAQKKFFVGVKLRQTQEELEKLARQLVIECSKQKPFNIAIPKEIGKPMGSYKVTNPWLRGAIYANENLFANFETGSKPRLLYVKEVPEWLPKTDVICIDMNTDITGFEIDYETMAEKNVVDKLDDILDMLNLNTKYILTGIKKGNTKKWI